MVFATVAVLAICLFAGTIAYAQSGEEDIKRIQRQRISINEDWRFFKYDSIAGADDLVYDVRPEAKDDWDHTD